MTHTKKRGFFSSFAIAGVLALTLGTSGAWADTQVYNLTVGNTAGAGGMVNYPGPYAKVTVVTDGTKTATITFEALSNGSNVYLFNNDVGINANNVTSASAVGTGQTGTGFNTPTYTAAVPCSSACNMDGFGNVTVKINQNGGQGGYSWSATKIVVTLTTTGTAWTGVTTGATPLLNPTPPALFIAEMGVCQSNCTDPTSGFKETGDVDGATPVPEPSILSLLGALGALMAIAVVRLRSPNTTNQA